MKNAVAKIEPVHLRLTRTAQNAAFRLPANVMPELDPAYSILAEILGIVPASCWTFAHISACGELQQMYGDQLHAGSRELLADEFRQQRGQAAPGPRMAPALRRVAGFQSGVTLLFADARAYHGILILRRTEDAGPFTSSEVSMLTFALHVLSERLSALCIHRRAFGTSQDHGARDTSRTEPDGAFYVLNSELQIMLAWTPADEVHRASGGVCERVAERLPNLLENAVRELTATWSSNRENARMAARPVAFLLLRVQPMIGPAGTFIGVRIDRFVPKNSLRSAAERYHISPREMQVLVLLLDGNHLHQIAAELNITPSTAQDHIKNMLGKTDTGSRSELIARVLGWESAPRDGLSSVGMRRQPVG